MDDKREIEEDIFEAFRWDQYLIMFVNDIRYEKCERVLGYI
jgi:hypothetical protein